MKRWAARTKMCNFDAASYQPEEKPLINKKMLVISMHTYLQQKQMCESGFDLVEEGFSLMRDGR
jgi:peroxiredoxin